VIARCLIEPAGREDDRSSVLSAELLRDADSCAVSFEVDIYERDIRSLTSRQLERFARRCAGPSTANPASSSIAAEQQAMIASSSTINTTITQFASS